MGGRGASSFQPNGNLNFQKGVLRTEVPETLKDALGRKSTPFSIEQSYGAANPYFSSEYSEYSANCQRCVVAYEMRRRGYDVTAMPTYDGDVKPRVAFSAEDGTISARWMGAFRGAKPEYVGARSGPKVISNISGKMNSYGVGARAVVQVYWKHGGGHVFNVENTGGKIRYCDAQTGKRVNVKKYMSNAKPGSVNLVRTDNLRVSERMREFVTRKK